MTEICMWLQNRKTTIQIDSDYDVSTIISCLLFLRNTCKLLCIFMCYTLQHIKCVFFPLISELKCYLHMHVLTFSYQIEAAQCYCTKKPTCAVPQK